MAKIRALIPLKLLISAAVLLGLSFAARPAIVALASAEQANSNVLLIAIPFLLIFIPIILGYMAVIVFVGKLIGGRVPEAVHRFIEYVFIAGIFLGIVGMFQPWVFALFKVSFLILLFSTLSFILWSHVMAKRTTRDSANGGEAEVR
jgi:hypothetical protein